MRKATIIVPCAGKSERFPNLRPKFLLVNPNGNLMLFDSISKINLKNCNLVVTILREHDEKYEIREMFDSFFKNYRIRLCILDKPTKSQSETVYKTVKNLGISGPILIKDSDSIFKLEKIYEDFNYVTTEYLRNIGVTNASNKSYALADNKGIILRIVEKKVISEIFCAGGYYFTDSNEFVRVFEYLEKKEATKELFVSVIIEYLVEKENVIFKVKPVEEYVDLGTIEEWLQYKNNQKTYFIDVDGVIVRNGGEYIKPHWGTTKGLKGNIRVINRLFDLGNSIILITSRKEIYRDATLKQLKKVGVKYDRLIMDLNHSARVVINDFSESNPFPSAISVNVPRDSDKLSSYIREI